MDIRSFAADPMKFFDALIIPSAKGNRPFKEVMAPHQREWFQTVAPSLLAVAAGKQPPIGRFWSERTKGGSKDSDIACCLLWLLAFSRQKLDMQVGAADRDQALELKKAAADILRLNEWLGTRVDVQSWSLVCGATGSECDILAADVAGSHGARPDVLVLNELSHVAKQEFAENLMDNATKKPQGLVIVATNAGLLGTWQHSWREMARESPRWDFHQFAQPAPWLSDAEIQEAQRRNSRARYDRLFWGTWVSQSGDALDQADIDACTTLPGPSGRQPGCFYAAGVDIGVKHDHSAVVVVSGRRDTQELQLAFAQSWSPDPATGKVDLIAVESTILMLNQRFKFAAVGYDPFQAALLAQRLDRMRVKVQEVPFVGKHLNVMASTLLEVFRSHRLRLYPHPQLISDLGRLSIVEKSYGHRLEATKDQNGHADTATALAIALPIAVELSGQPLYIASMGLRSNQAPYRSPFSRALSELEALADHEQELLSIPDDPHKDFRRLMRLVGR